MIATVTTVSLNAEHTFSKPLQPSIRLLAGLGVEGDAHLGVTVQHLSRIKKDPTMPNLRQVHLIHGELFDELAGKGFTVAPGDLGENVTTRGIDLLALPEGTRLTLGGDAVIEITGLRNPCVQIDRFAKGLMHAVLDHTPDGSLIRKAGVMAIVVTGGEVKPGDAIEVTLPQAPHRALAPV
ncbi:Putative metal-sulfur cluster biosynthesis proteins YuaD [Pandoraea terrae]|uniref:Metal-sulfur cluster biosynthesis proteins YuaD n=1 Tax=Pandoraea terrae TaxID=1537710 RepID=A0A5E4THU8_9BURK|nr:MOSC domain-containing protein [Pandoraea terrae]VVD85769.1 Putative metal-sulfur cluster biosynthesis proteins YuaD [Pandoraea terrae]